MHSQCSIHARSVRYQCDNRAYQCVITCFLSTSFVSRLLCPLFVAQALAMPFLAWCIQLSIGASTSPNFEMNQHGGPYARAGDWLPTLPVQRWNEAIHGPRLLWMASLKQPDVLPNSVYESASWAAMCRSGFRPGLAPGHAKEDYQFTGGIVAIAAWMHGTNPSTGMRKSETKWILSNMHSPTHAALTATPT